MHIPPDMALEPWSPPSYEVDGDGKVVGAVPGTPNNWGRWGPLDQSGTLNLLTPERVAAAAGLVREGRTFALGVPIGHQMPYPGSRSTPIHAFTGTTSDMMLGDAGQYSLQAADDFVVCGLQALTQLDGFGHIALDDVMYNGFWAGLVTAASGARRLGIHHLAQGIHGRGVLVDVAAYQGVEACEGGITVETLDAVLAAQSVELRPGDIMVLRTGVIGRWLRTLDNSVLEPPVGLVEATITWLAERDVAMVAADNLAVEIIYGMPDHPSVPFHHRALRDLGMMLAEYLDLEDLAAYCRETGRYEFLFVAQPLPFVNAVGSPLNPTAIL